MEVGEKSSHLTTESRAPVALQLSSAQPHIISQDVMSLPQVHPDPQARCEPFPLSDMQQAYLVGRSDPAELGNISCQSYSEVEVMDWNHERFEAALQRVIERHEMLRCVVLSEGRQQILPQVPSYRVESIDLRGQGPMAAAARLEAVRREMSQQVRPTDRWPLFDFRVSHLDSRRSRLHVSIDRLIADSRSLQIFFSELAQLYYQPEAFLPPLELSFRDYLLAFDSLKDTEVYRASREYWLKRLPALPPTPELPLATSLSSITQPGFKRRQVRIEATVWRTLKEKSAQLRLTPAGTLLAAYAEVLGIWSKNPSFTIGLTLFNRLPLHEQADTIIGDFTSVDLLEIDNSKPKAFEERARRVQEQLWRDLDHRYFSGIQVIQELSRSQRGGPNAIMPVVFTSLLDIGDQQNEEPFGAGQLGKITFASTQTPRGCLDVMVREERSGLVINWDAIEDLFPSGLLDDMFNGYRYLVEELASEDASWQRTLTENARRLIPVNQIDLREDVNDTAAPVSDGLLHTLFIKQVEERPNQTAVCTPTRRLSYAELYRRACCVEKQLLHRGVEPNQLVGVMMEKGWEQVVAVLGIHFAGGAYLPIDPELPTERQRHLVEHGQVKVVLTQSRSQHRLSLPAGVELLAVDLFSPADVGAPVVRRRQKPEDLAYVIYTSGSTGLPKGVMIDHRGAVNTVLDINQRFGIGPQDRVLAISRLSFDLSVYDIFGLLAAGGTIVMPSNDLAHDPAHWAELILSEKVTVWNTVPVLMQLLVEQAERPEAVGNSLRLIMMSGDWIPVNLPVQIRRILANAKIVSLGGATEASIWSILYPIEQLDPNWKSIPYGKPMRNQTFHVLNQMQAPCPVWVPGQLHIGGVGLAKGYWRDEQKTKASFIQDPTTGQPLYRTGDWGRYLPDGNIEFLGREDFQIKLNGYRIELGEIEARLQEREGVEKCVVAIREDKPGENHLVGYVVPKPGARSEAADLVEYLRAKLPEYMVPTEFVFLERFPLTPNGKVDRKALPAAARINFEIDSGPTAPRDTLELQLIKLWEKVLGVCPVGLKDNFWDLGGNSLTAVRLFAELRKLTGQNLTLSTLFQAPTVEKMADLLRRDGWSPSWSSLVPIQPGGNKPPFYCVHGGGGNVLQFYDLAHVLGPDYPFYGLQSQGLDGSKKYLTSIQEMAVHYLKELRELQPDGPYYLGGFCMGGHVAYEMAQRLHKDGQRVAQLVMVDAYNFNGVPPRLSFREGLTHIRQKIQFNWANLARLGLKEQLVFLRNKLKHICHRELESLFHRISSLINLNPLADGLKRSYTLLARINAEACFTYVPNVYPEKITIIKPHRHFANLRDPQMGWGGMAAGGLEIIELPVDPGGMFFEPYVRTLAEKLKTLIDEAQ